MFAFDNVCFTLLHYVCCWHTNSFYHWALRLLPKIPISWPFDRNRPLNQLNRVNSKTCKLISCWACALSLKAALGLNAEVKHLGLNMMLFNVACADSADFTYRSSCKVQNWNSFGPSIFILWRAFLAWLRKVILVSYMIYLWYPSPWKYKVAIL